MITITTKMMIDDKVTRVSGYIDIDVEIVVDIDIGLDMT